MKWSDFEERVRKNQRVTESWTFSPGQAFYTNGDLMSLVRIKLDGYNLEHDLQRSLISESDIDILLEFQIVGLDGVNTDDYIEAFHHVWERTVGDETITHFDPPPKGYRLPLPLVFTEKEKVAFKQMSISEAPLAPLYGQNATYFGKPVIEFNSGFDQGQVEGYPVAYRQKWVRKMTCPFCSHDDWNQTVAVELREPEKEYYSNEYLALICPRCDRCVDAIKNNYWYRS